MTPEKLKETRMKIAYNIIQGLAASGKLDMDYYKAAVRNSYEVADEVLKQGGYVV